jgi:hypothetical protein
MQRQVRSLQLVKGLLYHVDPEILVKATDLFNEALAGRISLSTPRRSRDGSDYHIIFHFTVEEGGSATSTPSAEDLERRPRNDRADQHRRTHSSR